MGGHCSNEYRVSVLQDEKFLEICCTTMCMLLKKYTLKILLCIFYHNKKQIYRSNILLHSKLVLYFGTISSLKAYIIKNVAFAFDIYTYYKPEKKSVEVT